MWVAEEWQPICFLLRAFNHNCAVSRVSTLTNKEAFAEVRLAPITSGPTEPAGTVIDSLQLLRTSLEHVAVSELSDTLENLSDLKTRLASLQKTIAIVAAMKNCDSRVRSAREEIDADIEQMRGAALTNPWLFATLLKPKLPVRSESPDPAVETFEPATLPLPETPAITPDVFAELSDFVPGDELVFDSRDLRDQDDPEPGTVETTEDESERSVINLNFCFEPERAVSDDTSTEADDSLSQSFELPQSLETEAPSAEARVETNGRLFPHILDDADGQPDNQTELHNDSTPRETHETLHAEPRADFDQKLLDDLIKNYGEFVASSPARPLTEEFEGFERTETRPEAESPDPPLPVPASAVAGSSTQHELDRELKKIIKDYGEVDLYSAGNRVTKRRAIVAFVVLGGVLSSIYMFSGPKADTVGNAPVVHQNQRTVDPTGATRASGAQLTNDAPEAIAPITGKAEQPARSSSGNSQSRQRLEKTYRKGGLQ